MDRKHARVTWSLAGCVLCAVFAATGFLSSTAAARPAWSTRPPTTGEATTTLPSMRTAAGRTRTPGPIPRTAAPRRRHQGWRNQGRRRNDRRRSCKDGGGTTDGVLSRTAAERRTVAAPRTAAERPTAVDDVRLPERLLRPGRPLPPGRSDTFCGKGGVACTDCSAINTTCVGQVCKGATCAGASTRPTELPGRDGHGPLRRGGKDCADCTLLACPNVACSAGACTCGACNGCTDNSHICQAGTANDACGTGGGTCLDCTSNGGTCAKGCARAAAWGVSRTEPARRAYRIGLRNQRRTVPALQYGQVCNNGVCGQPACTCPMGCCDQAGTCQPARPATPAAA